jgi:cold shock protein
MNEQTAERTERGHVVLWSGKGWGYIAPASGDGDLWVHARNVRGKGHVDLRVGARVEFVRVQTDRGERAIDVRLVGDGGVE